MAKIICADPAIQDLDAIADYIAFHNAAAAHQPMQNAFAAVERLQKFPRMGSLPDEPLGLPYGQLITPPC